MKNTAGALIHEMFGTKKPEIPTPPARTWQEFAFRAETQSDVWNFFGAVEEKFSTLQDFPFAATSIDLDGSIEEVRVTIRSTITLGELRAIAQKDDTLKRIEETLNPTGWIKAA